MFMPLKASTISLAAAVLCLAGCDSSNWSLPFKTGAKTPAPTTKPAGPADHADAKKMRVRIDELRAQNEMLTAKVQSLEFRERLLSGRLRKLQFANERQAGQIRALAKAPVERDRYKAKADSLALRVYKLQKENADLRRRLEALGEPTTKPAAPPATHPAPATRPAAE